jgi:hypothetical protein
MRLVSTSTCTSPPQAASLGSIPPLWVGDVARVLWPVQCERPEVKSVDNERKDAIYILPNPAMTSGARRASRRAFPLGRST